MGQGVDWARVPGRRSSGRGQMSDVTGWMEVRHRPIEQAMCQSPRGIEDFVYRFQIGLADDLDLEQDQERAILRYGGQDGKLCADPAAVGVIVVQPSVDHILVRVAPLVLAVAREIIISNSIAHLASRVHD